MIAGSNTRPQTCPQCKKDCDGSRPFCQRCGFDLDYWGGAVLTQIKCDYCAHVGKLSEEHVFGDWLRRRYLQAPEKRLFLHSRPDRVAFMHPSKMFDQRQIRASKPYEDTVRNVCAKCNSGWMSVLHREAGDTIVSLAEGLWPRLTDGQSKTLSRWAVMVTANVEAASRIRTFTTEQRHQLMNGDVPDGVRISIGRMKDCTDAGSALQRTFCLWFDEKDSSAVLAQSTFIVVERLALHIMSAENNQLLGYCLANRDLEQVELPRRIWPENEPPKLSSRRQRFTQSRLMAIQDGPEVGPAA